VLSLEDELLEIGRRFDIVYFNEASSRRDTGPFDVALIDGSVATPDAAEQIAWVRERAKVLITIGACATAGGIQALRNWGSVEAWKRAVYPRPEYVASLATSTPISAHVHVDFEIWGCPIDKGQLLSVLKDLLAGVQPRLPAHSVCLECKRRGNVCVLVAKGMPCMGPVTRTGCGALCPAMLRECYGCFGPAEPGLGPGTPPNTTSLARHFHQELQLIPLDVVRRFRGINGNAEPFRKESDGWERRDDAHDQH
jgi:sulfhydrogenase subunit delta